VNNNWFPNMNSAVMAWAKETTVYVSGKRTQDYKTYETFYEYRMKIFKVPSGQNLEMKPEGQRSWNRETLYADTKYNLNVDDIIYFENEDSERYRIMNKIDWSRFGFIQYEIMSDYA
jgi:hypothetical protein